jgi:8-oxo-dGTP diphosphatase
MSGEQVEEGQFHGVGMIVLKPESVLMVKRGKQPFLGHWSYPGGSVEAGESPVDAAVRELYEETGLSVQAPQMVGLHVVERAAPAAGTLTLHVFTARWQSGVPVAADDAAEAQFFGFAQVRGLVTTPKAEHWLERARALA